MMYTLEELFEMKLSLVEFSEKLPGVWVVPPDVLTTMELRDDNSRFFPTLDNSGRVVGGHFA
jgi:hypothetical protein